MSPSWQPLWREKSSPTIQREPLQITDLPAILSQQRTDLQPRGCRFPNRQGREIGHRSEQSDSRGQQQLGYTGEPVLRRRLAPGFVQGDALVPIRLGGQVFWTLRLYSASDAYPISQRWTVAGGEYSYFRLAATAVATVYHYLLGWPAPYVLPSWPKLLGVSGGVSLALGTAGLGWLFLAMLGMFLALQPLKFWLTKPVPLPALQPATWAWPKMVNRVMISSWAWH